ncbi:hypothetical protein QFC22_006192 [Naganishia vaughanmartiniae]|uniref:Uncharacterized protein n=1 Tax=Naganishia vaughanmartiniae TaxID=1424756 RepID=A0ACC2WLQ7_9TREE|nr:hypothetical protein QFC22_006192 [Naganishia vaughanmartiniae]
MVAAAAATRISVTLPEPTSPAPSTDKPSHWANDDGTLFHNPWPSFRQTSLSDLATMMYQVNIRAPPEPISTTAASIPVHKPDFTYSSSSSGSSKPIPAKQIKATWLGHACFLLELPATTPGKRGIRILLDPVFSDRCSPSAWVGPKRFTKVPCEVEDLPEIDAVIISHNHYDRKPSSSFPLSSLLNPSLVVDLDIPTLTRLLAHQKSSPPHLFMPLNTLYALPQTLKDGYETTQLDWWSSADLHVHGVGKARMTALPSQHFTARGVFDRNKALWASWSVEQMLDGDEDSQGAEKKAAGGKIGAKIWFGGDTGYCSVKDGQHSVDSQAPVCPAFKQIGEKYGGFDLGLIPIGAYDPRGFMSPIHNGPTDAVRMFKDTVRSTPSTLS